MLACCITHIDPMSIMRPFDKNYATKIVLGASLSVLRSVGDSLLRSATIGLCKRMHFARKIIFKSPFII
ncbi:MAG: hypothetical protein ACFFAH_03580 [Promethearchaeota archaeon]